MYLRLGGIGCGQVYEEVMVSLLRGRVQNGFLSEVAHVFALWLATGSFSCLS